jgi:transcriptional regulator EpsA
MNPMPDRPGATRPPATPPPGAAAPSQPPAQPPGHGAAQGDTVMLNGEQAQAIVRLLETAPSVHRRYQFFVWTQTQMQPLVAHQLMVCGAYQRHRRSVVFDTFHNIVLSPEVLANITDPDGALTRALGQAWIDGRGQPVAVALSQLDGTAAQAGQALRTQLGYGELLVHGVARPQRPSEIESLFIFGGPVAAERSAQRAACLDLVLPQLHRTWQRVVSTEHALLRPAAAGGSGGIGSTAMPPAGPGSASRPPPGQSITPRERQILQWVRDGNSNQQVADALHISPLTVKNHVQKILRKLGASNRAQAVARAMSMGLLLGADTGAEGGH